MSVFIRGGAVRTASGSNNIGVFIGQNIQNGWDSISPVKLGGGFSMGDGSAVISACCAYIGSSRLRQPTFDGDWKGNRTHSRMAGR
ncbi:MAG: hypothetical protein K6T30_06535 [Alicyclobacillus sp.]|nr:hypothetical protein [Alicyclobacillus sp.]